MLDKSTVHKYLMEKTGLYECTYSSTPLLKIYTFLYIYTVLEKLMLSASTIFN